MKTFSYITFFLYNLSMFLPCHAYKSPESKAYTVEELADIFDCKYQDVCYEYAFFPENEYLRGKRDAYAEVLVWIYNERPWLILDES